MLSNIIIIILRRKWCCFENGSLLFLTLSEIEPYINLDIFTISLAQQVDQIFYCLYTHLIKRNKPRNVQVLQLIYCILLLINIIYLKTIKSI